MVICPKNLDIYLYADNQNHVSITAQKIKFSIKDFFSKCDQMRSFLRIWFHLLKKSLMENFIFCAVYMSTWIKGLRVIQVGLTFFSKCELLQ